MKIKSTLNLHNILQCAVQLEASDIHFSKNARPIFRIHGDLQQVSVFPKLMAFDTEVIAKQIVGDRLWWKLVKEGELDMSYSVPAISRFRVNIYKQRSSYSIAIRVIPFAVPSIEELGMPFIINQFAQESKGLVLITGPTGSGKSTTLASMIQYMNKNMKRHIITLEDPVEYLHTHNSCIIEQREIGKDTKNFSTGLRASLRQDPDVILVGELRDLETISTALTAAETGHLVLATVHTSSAPSTVERVIDVFPDTQQNQIRLQLASCLVGIISQRLIPRKDGNGRVVATEVLLNNTAVSNLIRTEKVHQIINVLQTGRHLGMHTMQSSVQELVKSGVISSEVSSLLL